MPPLRARTRERQTERETESVCDRERERARERARETRALLGKELRDGGSMATPGDRLGISNIAALPVTLLFLEV